MPETIPLDEYKRVFMEVIKEDRQQNFFLHLAVYIIVNAVSAVINLLFTPQFLWIIFPVFFWGIGVIWSYISSFILIDDKLEDLSLKAEYIIKKKN